MPTPVNNPTTPTLDGVNPAIPANETCEEIKARFGIESDTHRRNSSGSTKKTSRSYQSHHIFQDAGLKDIIPRPDAFAVMLANSHRGTEHGTITGNQNERRNNKATGRGGTMPGATYGEVKKQARGDLVEGLEGKRKDKNTGKPASKEEAEKLADCLVAEADKAVQKEATKDGGDPVDDSTPVAQPGGCFVLGTIVWLDHERRVLVERLPGHALIDTARGRARVVRVDECRHTTVELEVDGQPSIHLAAYHRLQTSDGRLVRADRLLVGEELAAHGGPVRVTATTQHSTPQRLFSFGFGHAARCRVGAHGLWVEVVDSGPEVVRSDLVTTFRRRLPCL
jgi:hypothetical protein